MEFRLLGRLEVRDGGREFALGGGKQRALLAVLLLHAGEVVPREQLIDALWGERPPQSAPNSVHVYVSKLRRALGDERLVTRGRGYALLLEPDELDLDRFECLLSRGRELLGVGDAHGAAAALREALQLWRGPPLSDFAYEPFAQAEIARLDALRLTAREERIEADLQLGRHSELVTELEALVREEPLRERLRAQLMVALYRCGRQADALAAYQQARRTLVEELGLEPAPDLQELERAILRHDPELAAPTWRATRLDRRAGGVVAVVGGALLLAAVAAVVVALTRHGGGGGISTLAPNSVGVIDARSHRIVADIPVPGTPARLAIGRPLIWVGSDDGRTVSGIDPATHAAGKLVAIGAFPSDLAAGEGAVWAVDRQRGLLVKIDPSYGVVARRTTVARRSLGYDGTREGLDPTAVAAGLGSVWTTDGSRTLTRIEPATATVLERIDLGVPLDGVAVGVGGVWAISGAAAAAIRLDSDGRPAARIQIASEPGLESPYPRAVAAGEGFVWVLNGNTATITKIDPAQRAVAATISIPIVRGPSRIAVGAGAAWVANDDGTIARIDPSSNAVEIIPVAHRLKDIAVVNGAVWVTAGAGLSGNVVPNVSGARVHALPASSCAPIYYGTGGQPQYLIASDLQLQGTGRTGIAQLDAAIAFVLRAHRFHAGRYAIGYQACNDATLAGYPSQALCERNATNYARDRDVIGVIGPFTSGCATTEVPIANSAPGGPLGMISPTNTYVGLTRHVRGSDADEPQQYFPSGARSFVRVIPTDDLQAAADAVLAQHLGARSAYLVQAGDYGATIARYFRSAARKLGLRIVGYSVWDYSSSQPFAIARQARRARADTVVIAACAICDPRLGTLIRRLRADLGPDAKIIATDGFFDFDRVKRIAGSAAEGMMVSVPGLPNERLPGPGKAFVAAFRDAVGESPSQYSVHAAQATEILLDASARSDGSRAAVTRELFKTKVSNGILGSFSIDKNGDSTGTSVAIYRIVHGAPKLFDVIAPPRSLVR